MKTAKRREDDFRRDFKKLLLKHNAEIDKDYEIMDIYYISTVTMYTQIDETGDVTGEFTEFRL